MFSSYLLKLDLIKNTYVRLNSMMKGFMIPKAYPKSTVLYLFLVCIALITVQMITTSNTTLLPMTSNTLIHLVSVERNDLLVYREDYMW